MAYAHTKVIDSFHTVQGQKIRVTTDEKTGVREECVSKVRIADLNIYNPKRKVDWRVSVNVETPGVFINTSLVYRPLQQVNNTPQSLLQAHFQRTLDEKTA